jgi:outer membrane protein assembly factor BamB
MEITASPNFYEDSVVFTSQDGTLYRLKKETGELVWKYETEEPILCGASLAGDLTFLGGCDERLHIVDVKTGKPVTEPITIGPTASTPSVVDDSVLIPTHAGDIFNFATPANTERWRFKDEKLSDEFKNSVAVANGLAVATGRNKRVFAIEIATGKVKWVQMLRKRSDASPIIAGKSVIIAAADGRIIRYDLQSGDQQWLFEVKGAFLAAPAVSDGKLVLANDRGTIFCFGEKS